MPNQNAKRGSDAKSARALVILAGGAEEMEATISVDVLRRAEIEVVLAGLEGPDPVRCARGLRVLPDTSLADAAGPFDVIVLPGGKGGAERLAGSAAVGELLRSQVEAGRTVAAICVAPIALRTHGIFEGSRMTCHPSVNEVVGGHGRLTAGAVVTDGQLITSQGPGTAFLFALAVVERLRGADVAEKVRGPLMLP